MLMLESTDADIQAIESFKTCIHLISSCAEHWKFKDKAK